MTVRLARRSPVVATAAVVAAAFCWGLSAIFAKGAFERGVTPAQMAEARVVVAALPLLAFLAWRRRDLLRPPRGTTPALLLFGVAVVIVNWSYYVAIDRLPVGVAISLQYTAPVLVLAFLAVVAHRTPGRLAWVAGALTLLGAILVSRAYAGVGAIDGIGLAAGIGSSVTFAAYLLTAEAAARRGTHPATVLGVGFVVATLLWSALQPWWNWPFHLLADVDVAWRVLAVGLLGTLLPFLLSVSAVHVISAGVAGIAATSEPLFASALAWLLLQQALSLPQVAGAACIVAGVVLAQLSRPDAPQPAESVPIEVTP